MPNEPATDPAPASSRVRLVGLDYVRGLASLLVVIVHFGEWIRLYSPSPEWTTFGLHSELAMQTWWNFGKLGVAAFFCVSGAVIPMSLPVAADTQAKRTILRRFAIARFFRLYPMYWFSLVMAFALHQSQVQGRDALINVTMLQRFIGVPDALGVYWTLQIELIFYGLCAALYARDMLHRTLVQDRMWQGMLAASALLALARHSLGIKLPVAIPLALTLMFFSFRWRAFFLAARGALRNGPPRLHWAALLGGLIFSCYVGYSDETTWRGFRYVSSYLIGISLFKFLSGLDLGRGGRSLALLGAASYALYLLHPVIGVAILQWFRANQPHVPGVAALLATVASILVSYLAYLAIEKPAISLGRLLAQGISPARISDQEKPR